MSNCCLLNMSLELEVLDQLQGGDLRLRVIAGLFPSQEAFERGVEGLLSCGDVILSTADGSQVPKWQWRHLFDEHGVFDQLDNFKLAITPQGGKRIG